MQRGRWRQWRPPPAWAACVITTDPPQAALTLTVARANDADTDAAVGMQWQGFERVDGVDATHLWVQALQAARQRPGRRPQVEHDRPVVAPELSPGDPAVDGALGEGGAADADEAYGHRAARREGGGLGISPLWAARDEKRRR